MSVGALQSMCVCVGGIIYWNIDFISGRLYQQSYLNSDNKEHCKFPKCIRTTVYTQSLCNHSNSSTHTQAPEPAATPQAAQPLIFAEPMICSGIQAISKASSWPCSQIELQKHIAPGAARMGRRGGNTVCTHYLMAATLLKIW